MGLDRIIWAHYGKLLVLLVIAVIILQGFHMVYLMRIQISQGNKQYPAAIGMNDKKPHIKQNDILKYIKHIEEAHIMDTSGMYILIPNIVTPNIGGFDSSRSNRTTLLTMCTQTSSNHLNNLIDLTSIWEGPLSVTVFTHEQDVMLAVYYIAYFHACFESVKTQVSFHIVYPLGHRPQGLRTSLNMELHCNKHVSHQIDQTMPDFSNTRIPYPHNLLRNVAITYSTTEYIQVIDIDLLPSLNLHEQFDTFIRRKLKSAGQDKVIYVTPAFESSSNKVRYTKESLLLDLKSEVVRPFYITVCPRCQKVIDYDRWSKLPPLSFLDIGYELEWEDPWEPFYIARKQDLPLYDSRFKQYGFNRISQVCELHIAGYQFAVLNNAFVVHQSFKEPDKYHSSKQEENNRNKELFRTFKQQLKDRYPDSDRNC